MNRYQVAVVGGGPAGLSAAIAAAASGAETVLLDEQQTLGGQLRYRIAEVATEHDSGTPPRRARVIGHELANRALDAGVTVRLDAVVWGCFANNVLGIAEGATSMRLQADQIVLATGSTDRPHPFAGGTLPGVFSARAIQILLHVHRIRPGRRFLIIGAGTEAQELASDIRLAGGEVVQSVDPMAAEQSVLADGQHGVETVTIGDRRHAVDAIVVAVGRQPDTALALMAGCAAGYSSDLGGYVPIRDADLRTNPPGIFVAGDAAGVCDVAVARAEGTLAGLNAAAALGYRDSASIEVARGRYDALDHGRISAAQALTPTYAQA